MTTDTAQLTLTTLAISGALGYLLPSLDKTWESDPRISGMDKQVTRSGVVFAVISLSAGLIGSKAAGSLWPLGVAVTVTLLTFHVYGEALSSIPKGVS